jgi:hypothetical protein
VTPSLRIISRLDSVWTLFMGELHTIEDDWHATRLARTRAVDSALCLFAPYGESRDAAASFSLRAELPGPTFCVVKWDIAATQWG